MSVADSIAFLRSLKGQEQGATIYQKVIDDVLSELDEQRRRADNVPRIRDALRVILDDWNTGHNMHWDRQGNGGATCPACILDRQARAQLRAQLESIENA